MKEKMSATAEMLWSEITRGGAVCHAVGSAFLNSRPLSNLTEALGIGGHEGLDRMMRMSGVEEAYITGGASDYDKLEALCGVLPMWSGHPYYIAVQDLLTQGLGVVTPLTVETLPLVWREVAERLFRSNLSLFDLSNAFGVGRLTVHLGLDETLSLPQDDPLADGMDLRLSLDSLPDVPWCSPHVSPLGRDTAAEDMTGCVTDLLNLCAARGCRGVTVRLRGVKAFVRPNPYTPAQAVLKRQKGEPLTAEEQALVVFQSLRLLGGECVRRGWRLTLTDLSPSVLEPLGEYMKRCGCLPETASVVSAPDEAILLPLSPLSPLSPLTPLTPLLVVDPTEPSEALTIKLAETAARMPLGCLGGLYVPLQGALDLPLWSRACKTLCRFVADLGANGRGTDVPDEQIRLVQGILC